MLKLYNTKLENYQINSICLIDDNIYILYHIENTKNILELHLSKICLKTRTIKDEHILIKELINKLYIKKAKIIKNYIYVYTKKSTFIYDYNIKIICKYDGFIINIFDFNNKTYFLKSFESKYFVEDIDNNIIIKIIFHEGVNYIKKQNNIINLYLEIWDDCNIFYHNNYLIFHKGIIIAYNIKTQKILQLYDNYKKINDEEYIVNIDEYNIYTLSTNTYQKLDDKLILIYNESDILIKLNENNYITFNETNFELTLYYMINKFNNVGDKIIIGNLEKKVEISLNFLLNNSEYIRNIFNDFSDENIKKELIHSGFVDIDIYHKFVNNEFIINNVEINNIDVKNDINGMKTNIFDIENYFDNINNNIFNLQINLDNIKNNINTIQNNLNNVMKNINNIKKYSNDLMKLYKVCDFLQDKNINIVEKMIINNIIYNKTDIEIDFNYLELFYRCGYQHLTILCIIKEKYPNIINSNVLYKYK